MSRSYCVFCGIVVGLMALLGCAQERHQPVNWAAFCPAYEFYLTDAEKANLTAKASTNAEAAYRLSLYYGGYRFETDSSMAWLRKAAEQGDAKAQYALGVCMMSVPGYVDMKQSKAWLEKSAAQGYESAKEVLSSFPQ